MLKPRCLITLLTHQVAEAASVDAPDLSRHDYQQRRPSSEERTGSKKFHSLRTYSHNHDFVHVVEYTVGCNLQI